MSKKTTLDKIRRGVKDDSSLHKLYWEMRREREAKRLPPDDNSFDPEATIAEWNQERAAARQSGLHLRQVASSKKGKSLQDKIRRGVKVDASLHALEREIRLEREAKGLPPEDRAFNPKKVFAEWRRKHEMPKSSISGKISSNKNKRLLRQFTISIEQIPEHGYWASCSAVNGKRLHGETMTEAWEKMTAFLGHRLEKLTAKSKSLPKTSTRMKK